jgi:NAD(P)H-hydrate repair Nnr-like enzyme with NAD(P)H-hydrate dehydratase domain
MIDGLGACLNDHQSIVIDANSHSETQASVLLHEVLHAIDISMGLGLKHKAIDALEAALYQVLVDNPPWWTKETA